MERVSGQGRLVPLLLVLLEATRTIVGDRVWMVERAGVQPHAGRAASPCLGRRCGEHRAASPLAGRLGEEPEVSELDVALVVALQLEVAGRLGADEELVNAHPWLC